MQKRKVIFGAYDTAAELWTMEACKLSDPQHVTDLVDVPGSFSVDMATALTGGVPYYTNRTLTVQLTTSEGTRQDRLARISDMVNLLSGQRVKIVLPDDADHYLMGTVGVVTDYSDMAHAGVTVTAFCDPWRYANVETVACAQFCGKNLLDGTARATQVTENGVTVRYDATDDVYIINGTAAATTSVYRLWDIMGGAPVGTKVTASARYVSGTVTEPADAPYHNVLYVGAGDPGGIVNNFLTAVLLNENTYQTAPLKWPLIRSSWFYFVKGTVFNDYRVRIQFEIGATATAHEPYAPVDSVTLSVTNARCPVVPVITCNDSTTVTMGDTTVALDYGVHSVHTLRLLPGVTEVTATGKGAAVLTYREAVL